MGKHRKTGHNRIVDKLERNAEKMKGIDRPKSVQQGPFRVTPSQQLQHLPGPSMKLTVPACVYRARDLTSGNLHRIPCTVELQ